MSAIEPIHFPMKSLPIPTSWTNALSYMEMIGKLVDKINELIDATPVDINLTQINNKLNTLENNVGNPYSAFSSLDSRCTSLLNRILAVDAKVTALETAVGIPYTNPANLNTRVTTLEFAQGGDENG